MFVGRGDRSWNVGRWIGKFEDEVSISNVDGLLFLRTDR